MPDTPQDFGTTGFARRVTPKPVRYPTHGSGVAGQPYLATKNTWPVERSTLPSHLPASTRDVTKFIGMEWCGSPWIMCHRFPPAGAGRDRGDSVEVGGAAGDEKAAQHSERSSSRSWG